MSTPPTGLYAGLAGLDLDTDEIPLGRDVVLRRTYAHLMGHFMVALAQPEAGQHHPGPWKPATGGFTTDVTGELFVPKHLITETLPGFEIVRNIVALMRLYVSPTITFPLYSTHSFQAARDETGATPLFRTYEAWSRSFILTSPDGGKVKKKSIDWVANHWWQVIEMRRKHPNFGLALDALDSGQFIDNPSLILVAVWAALESLFSPDNNNELSFRVSAFITCYLEEPGPTRRPLQREIKKLYGARSKAAHGSGQSETKTVLDSINLLRRILIRMITTNHVPSQGDLEDCLFGLSEEDD